MFYCAQGGSPRRVRAVLGRPCWAAGRPCLTWRAQQLRRCSAGGHQRPHLSLQPGGDSPAARERSSSGGSASSSASSRMPAWLEKLKTSVGLQEEQEAGTQGLLSQLDEATTLNRTQRLIGFAACFGLGMLLTMLVRCRGACARMCGHSLQGLRWALVQGRGKALAPKPCSSLTRLGKPFVFLPRSPPCSCCGPPSLQPSTRWATCCPLAGESETLPCNVALGFGGGGVDLASPECSEGPVDTSSRLALPSRQHPLPLPAPPCPVLPLQLHVPDGPLEPDPAHV